MTNRPPYPFDSERRMGTVSHVSPSSVRANLPLAGKAGGRLHHGNRVGGGEVGEFVLIECDELALLGRILEVRLPERERLSVEDGFGHQPELHPVGMVQLLATLDISRRSVKSGVARYPRLGSRIFAAHPDYVRWIASEGNRQESNEDVNLVMGALPDASNALVSMSPKQLIGRHCAILGATGGGKSWTVARLVEQAMRYRAKVILLDATGEFYPLKGDAVTHKTVGIGTPRPAEAEIVEFPYTDLSEIDLFGIFTPSGQSQGPKLREAIRSLKLAKLEPGLANDGGNVVKANKQKQPILDAYQRHVREIEGPSTSFDIKALAQQIAEECVWPNGGNAQNPDPSKWGNASGEVSYVVSLQMRIDSIVKSQHLDCIFSPSGATTVPQAIDSFITDDQKSVLRISLQNVSFAHNAREIVANAVGRCLLDMARNDRFRERPVLVIVDEAHQFLNKTIGDESCRVDLEAFGLIAKEGRKHGLNICIATQRPRDIPDDVLSQMGTLVVHRLINDRDRSVVERASGEIDKSAAAFLPTLGPGEAVVIGVDVPVPLSIRIQRPDCPPDSTGPAHEICWAKPVDAVMGTPCSVAGSALAVEQIDEGEFHRPDGAHNGVRAHINWHGTDQKVGPGSLVATPSGNWEIVDVNAEQQSVRLQKVV